MKNPKDITLKELIDIEVYLVSNREMLIQDFQDSISHLGFRGDALSFVINSVIEYVSIQLDELVQQQSDIMFSYKTYRAAVIKGLNAEIDTLLALDLGSESNAQFADIANKLKSRDARDSFKQVVLHYFDKVYLDSIDETLHRRFSNDHIDESQDTGLFKEALLGAVIDAVCLKMCERPVSYTSAERRDVKILDGELEQISAKIRDQLKYLEYLYYNKGTSIPSLKSAIGILRKMYPDEGAKRAVIWNALYEAHDRLTISDIQLCADKRIGVVDTDKIGLNALIHESSGVRISRMSQGVMWWMFCERVKDLDNRIPKDELFNCIAELFFDVARSVNLEMLAGNLERLTIDEYRGYLNSRVLDAHKQFCQKHSVTTDADSLFEKMQETVNLFSEYLFSRACKIEYERAQDKFLNSLNMTKGDRLLNMFEKESRECNFFGSQEGLKYANLKRIGQWYTELCTRIGHAFEGMDNLSSSNRGHYAVAVHKEISNAVDELLSKAPAPGFEIPGPKDGVRALGYSASVIIQNGDEKGLKLKQEIGLYMNGLIKTLENSMPKNLAV